MGGTVIVQHHLTMEFHSFVQLLKLFCLSRVGFHRIQYPEIINTLQFMAQMTHLYIRAGGHVEHVPQRERSSSVKWTNWVISLKKGDDLSRR